MNEIAAIEQVLINGDLAKLNAEQRVQYYKGVCDSIGLNPLTKPFDYITLNGKLVLYAAKNCAEQLRNLKKVSLTITSREQIGDVYVVTAEAKLPDGRTDASTGAVTIANLKGDNLANAMMKAETKAKRRVTLSVCSLGMLDEMEVETINSQKIVAQQPPQDGSDGAVGDAHAYFIPSHLGAGPDGNRTAFNLAGKNPKETDPEMLSGLYDAWAVYYKTINRKPPPGVEKLLKELEPYITKLIPIPAPKEPGSDDAFL